MVKIKWTNKYSNETGFVKDVDKKNRHFINTFDENEAKTFTNLGLANIAINQLVEFGEGNNNDFETIAVKVDEPVAKTEKLTAKPKKTSKIKDVKSSVKTDSVDTTEKAKTKTTKTKKAVVSQPSKVAVETITA